MEVCSQAVSIESFSYRWLVNIRSSFESHASSSLRASFEYEANSFIEMDPTMPPSKRFFSCSSSSDDDNFKFPALSPSPTPSHADRLISNGYLIPVYESTTGAGASPVVKLPGEPRGKLAGSSSCSLRKSCRRLLRQIFEKYLNFVRPVWRRIQRNGKLRCGGQIIVSREAINQCCSDEWRRSCDSESSIYDAVLHCKRSIGK